MVGVDRRASRRGERSSDAASPLERLWARRLWVLRESATVAALAAAAWAAFQLRFEFAVPEEWAGLVGRAAVMLAILQYGLLALSSVHRRSWRFTGIGDALVVLRALGTSAVAVGALHAPDPDRHALGGELRGLVGLGLRDLAGLDQVGQRVAEHRGAQRPHRALRVTGLGLLLDRIGLLLREPALLDERIEAPGGALRMELVEGLGHVGLRDAELLRELLLELRVTRIAVVRADDAGGGDGGAADRGDADRRRGADQDGLLGELHWVLRDGCRCLRLQRAAAT